LLKLDVTDGLAVMRALLSEPLQTLPRVAQLVVEVHVCEFVPVHEELVRVWDDLVQTLATRGWLLTHKEVNMGAITPASAAIVRWEEHCHWTLTWMHVDLS
jgi:hypothetical protein